MRHPTSIEKLIEQRPPTIPVVEPKVLAGNNFVFGSNHNQPVKLQQMLVRLVNSLHALNLEVRVSHGRARGIRVWFWPVFSGISVSWKLTTGR